MKQTAEHQAFRMCPLSYGRNPQSVIRNYYPALNGLRGVAILMVFFCHYGCCFADPKYFAFLWPGVDLFFVLSGFLITGILYDAKTTPNYFRHFYIRRALRIFPLYYGFFLIIALLTPVLRLHYDKTLWSFLFYVGNFFTVNATAHNPSMIYFGPIYGHTGAINLGPLWSLCVEEQFYLVWPVLIWLLASRRAMMWFSGVAVLMVLCLRTFLFLHDPAKAMETRYLYYSTYTRCDALLIGSWVALWLRGVPLSSQQIRRIAYPVLVVCMLILVTGFELFSDRWPAPFESNPMLSTYGYTLVGLVAACVLLLALDESSTVYRVLCNKRLGALGIVSYGFYFLHGMLWSQLTAMNARVLAPRHLGLFFFFLWFATVYCTAWLSFHYFESPFLMLKRRLAPGHKSVPSGGEDVSPLALAGDSTGAARLAMR